MTQEEERNLEEKVEKLDRQVCGIVVNIFFSFMTTLLVLWMTNVI